MAALHAAGIRAGFDVTVKSGREGFSATSST
jgi:hypothetical protein